jgi:hypothetical protein
MPFVSKRRAKYQIFRYATAESAIIEPGAETNSRIQVIPFVGHSSSVD